jgi:hypothetical protein
VVLITQVLHGDDRGPLLRQAAVKRKPCIGGAALLVGVGLSND